MTVDEQPAAPAGPPAQENRFSAVDAFGLSPRTALLLVSGFSALLLAAGLALLPVPYARLSPGPVFNTLGTYGGKTLISISGRTTYPTSGQLDLTTVNVQGGPNGKVSVLTLLRGWLSPRESVVPVDALFPPGQTAEDEEKQNRAEMVSSQESATAAALTELGIDYTTTLTVAGTQEDAPASGLLRKGDVLVSVGGAPVTDLDQLRDVLQATTPGASVDVVVRRSGARTAVSVKTIADGDRTLLGIFVDPSFDFPFDVKITIDNVGGPSAGTMFALGIIDTLTPGELTGGADIAGTGTMDVDGSVGPIGGIQQKLAGARGAGAEWFLAPASNCDEVVGHVPDGLRVVRIATLDEARTAVETIAKGGAAADALATCTR